MSDDKELKVMATVLPAMESLDAEERKRVILWLTQKLSIELSGGRNISAPRQNEIMGSASISASTDTIANLIGARSGPDLILAAAAHLHFSQNKQTFTRQDIVQEMRSAPGHFKETFVNNLSKYLVGLTKVDRLRLVGAHTYALSNKERQGLEAKLANA